MRRAFAGYFGSLLEPLLRGIVQVEVEVVTCLPDIAGELPTVKCCSDFDNRGIVDRHTHLIFNLPYPRVPFIIQDGDQLALSVTTSQ
jgi:hypothetical protein